MATKYFLLAAAAARHARLICSFASHPLLQVPAAVFQFRKSAGKSYIYKLDLLWSLQPRLLLCLPFALLSQTKPASLVQDAFPACLVISHRPSPYRPHPLIGMALAKTSRPSTLRKVVSHSPDGSLWKSSQGNV